MNNFRRIQTYILCWGVVCFAVDLPMQFPVTRWFGSFSPTWHIIGQILLGSVVMALLVGGCWGSLTIALAQALDRLGLGRWKRICVIVSSLPLALLTWAAYAIVFEFGIRLGSHQTLLASLCGFLVNLMLLPFIVATAVSGIWLGFWGYNEVCEDGRLAAADLDEGVAGSTGGGVWPPAPQPPM